MKRHLIFMLTVAVMLQGLCIPTFAEDSAAASRIVFKTDFEPGSAEPVSRVEANMIKSDNPEYNYVLDFSGSQQTNAFFNFAYPISTGKVSISYDLMHGQTDKESYERALSGPYKDHSEEAVAHMHETFIVRNTGNFQMFNNMKWDVTGAPTKAYEENIWYHIDEWFDFDKRTVSYYIDGVLLGETNMSDSFTQLQGFYRSMAPNSVSRMDNLYVVEYQGGGIDMTQYPFIMYYPPELEHEVMTEIEIDNEGHIFFGKDITLRVNMTEEMGKDFSGVLTAAIYSENGTSKSIEKNVEVKAGEELKTEVALTADVYGFYDVEAVLTDNTGKICGKDTTRLSVAVRNEKKNEYMGFSQHTSKRYGGPEQLEIAERAGAGFTRDEFRWTSAYTVAKGWGIDNPTQSWLDKSGELGLNSYAILGYSYPGIMNEKFPTSEQGVSMFLEYVRYTAEQTKDLDIDYEFWNEFNLSIVKGEVDADEEDYVNLLKKVYPLVKSINPDADVYAMTTASGNNYDGFIERCLELGAGDYLDGISIHPYDWHAAPDAGGVDEMVNTVVGLMEKYGIGHKKLCLSEFGWTTSVNYVSEDHQANYTVEAAALLRDRVTKIAWYNLVEKTVNGMPDAELHFGMVRGFASTDIANPDIKYEAKPALIAYAAYNSLMNECEPLGQISHSDERAVLHLFNNNRGNKTLMCWAKGEGNEVVTGLDVGCDYVTIYDRYGNGNRVKTRNGVIDINLTWNPIYIDGDLGEIKEAAADFSVQSSLSVVEDDYGTISGMLPQGEWDITAELPDNISIDGEIKISDGAFKIPVKTGVGGKENEKISILIAEKGSGETVYRGEISVEYQPQLKVESDIKYYKNSHWQLFLKLTNNKSRDEISGKVVIEEPTGLAISKGAAEFRNLQAGGSRYVFVNIPLEMSSRMLDIKGYVELDTGSRITFEESSYFVGLMKTNTPPTIDGVIEDGEYVTDAPAKIDSPDMVKQIADYGGESDLCGTVYLNYDADYFYLAAKVRDNVDAATDGAARVWANDGIQFAFAEYARQGASRTEIGIGKDNEGNPTMQRYSFLGTKFFAGDYQEAVSFEDTCALEITREGDITTYELRMPWVDIYGDSAPTFTKRSAYMSIIINDNDGTGRRGWIEFCPGIGSVKNAALFMKIPAVQ